MSTQLGIGLPPAWLNKFSDTTRICPACGRDWDKDLHDHEGDGDDPGPPLMLFRTDGTALTICWPCATGQVKGIEQYRKLPELPPGDEHCSV